MNVRPGTVHVVDDDAEMAASLRYFFEAHWLHVRTYASAEEFLAQPEPEPGCLILDLRMPGMGGLELIERLAGQQRLPPTIVLTAHGDMPAAIAALKCGAVEFLQKPHDSRQLLDVAQRAIERGVGEAAIAHERRRLAEASASLTHREREILAALASGRSTRQIAELLGLQAKSVEVYRSRMLGKLGYDSSLELVASVLRACPHLAESPALGGGSARVAPEE